MITYIPREKLEPHPDNPRKNLGDLKELSDSIRKQGLLQNLIVVPHPEDTDKYRIVIGHRRFAASGFAGLKELPCIIDEKMTYPEQIAVMMSENIQRNELTVSEKVGGVQMMMDLGMDAGEISGNTGISSSTVYRYAKLTRLNKGGLVQAEQRGATLLQLSEICEIEDPELQQMALEKAGTNEYSNVMHKVRTARNKKTRTPGMIEKLKEFAQPIENMDYSVWMWREYFNFNSENAMAQIENFERTKGSVYGYCVRDYDIALYEKQPETDSQKAEEKRRAAERIRERTANECNIAQRFKDLRDDFMRRLNLKGREEAAKRFILWVITRTEYLNNAMIGGLFDKAFGAYKQGENGTTSSIKISADEIRVMEEKRLMHALVLVAYDRINGGDCCLMDRYSGKRKESTKMLELYQCLRELGYEPCEEELEWLAGTHACFEN